MAQETGETRDAIIEQDNKMLKDIMHANRDRKGLYWVVLFAKPCKQNIDGKPTLVKHMKAYGTRPASMVGVVLGEVDNEKGTVRWEVNMPQRPFDFDALKQFGAESCDEVVTETTSIPGAYITK